MPRQWLVALPLLALMALAGPQALGQAGVGLTESGGSTSVSEAGPTSDTYTIVLNSAPAADVQIIVDPDADTQLGAGGGAPILMTFTTSNWNVAQTITVTAVDDAEVEGVHGSTILHTASSADPDYDGIAIHDLVVSVSDDDSAGVTISESGGSTDVAESGPTADSYELVLESRPSANVVVTVTPDSEVDLGSGAGVPIVLTFTPGTWNLPRDVFVTAVDDADAEGPHTSTIAHSASSTDDDYNGIGIADVVVNVTDNDAAGVGVTESGGSTSVSEDGPTSDSYNLVLLRAPTATVTITIDPDADLDLGAGPGAAITRDFTTADWSVTRTLSVTAVDDANQEGPHTSTIVHSASSADPDYDGLAISDVVVSIADNDTVGVGVTESGGATTVSEFGATSDAYTVVLNSQPTATVLVTVDPDQQTDLGAGAGAAITLTFLTSNWNAAQTVTVTAVDDEIAEGAHTSTITHSASSADAAYDGIAIVDVVASVTDDDDASVSVTQSGGSTEISEAGPTSDSYTLVLTSAPLADVTVSVDPDADSDVGAGPGVAVLLTFTSANWDTAQTVTVSAVDDAIAEGDHTSTIAHSAASGDPAYDGLSVPAVVADVADDDAAGVTRVESGASTAVDETGPTADTYTLVLDSEPTANVVITVDPDAQTNLGAGAGTAISLTFTSADWDTPQTVTVTAVDDAVAEGAHTSTLTHALSSADPLYDGFALADVSAAVTDNDTAGVTVAESGGATAVAEAGPTSDTYTVVLNSQPTANVTLTIDPDQQSDVGGGAASAVTLTFTTANWATPQTVTVTAVDDAVDEGPHTSTIAHGAGSADPNYNGIAIGDVTATVTDNDTAGVSVLESGGTTSVDESGPTSDTYTLVLNTQPVASVTVTVDPDGQTNLGSGAGAAVTRTFTSANWSTPQTITVTAVDDVVAEGPHTSTITHAAASTDSNYNAIAIAGVTADVADDDVAGVDLAESGSSTDVNETGPTSDTYTLVLWTEPTSDVTITADPDGQSDLGAGAGVAQVLLFTPANWNTPQTVTVTAVDDAAQEGPHTSSITHAADSADSAYDGLAIPSVSATVIDNDTPGVLLAESDGSTAVNESGPTSDAYTLVLESQPAAAVTITVDPDAQTDAGAGAGIAVTRVFNPANWNTPQSVTLTAVDDVVAEGAHSSTVVHTASSGDVDYDGIAIAALVAAVTDNDSAGVSLIESGGTTIVSETGPTSDTYTVVLDTQPTASVTITVDPDAETDVGSGPGAPVSLVFTTADWSVERTVVVTAVDDAVPEGPHGSTISHTASSADSTYNGIGVADVTAGVTDNDVPGVTVIESGGATAISETGPSSDAYTIVLDSQPTADVVVTVDPDAQSDAGAGADNPIALTFTSANWSAPQTVTVTAVDDLVQEGPHTSTLSHSAHSGDANYDGMAIGDVVAAVSDNDAADVVVTQSGGSTGVAESGPTTDAYTIVLATEPTADVTVAVDPDVQLDLGSGPGIARVLTFTSANWATPQTVHVTAVDDAIAEGAHNGILVHTVASADPGYDAFAVADIAASVTDNDAVGVTISQSGGSTAVSEAGPTSDAYTIVLNSQPTATVTLTVDPDAQTDLGAGAGVAITLAFTTANWSTAQTVTVTAVDDALDEGAHTSTITHAAASADSGYDGLGVASVVAAVSDDDVADILLAESDGATAVHEHGPTSDTYTLVLGSQPTANVSILVDPQADVDLGPGPGSALTLVFTPANWSTPQTVVVTAVDDADPEGPHTASIVHTVSSSDPTYNGWSLPEVTVSVIDDDVPGVTLAQTGGTTQVQEDGPTSDTYTLVLDSPPTADVTITATPDAQVDLGAGPGAAVAVLFPSGSWNVPRTLILTAVDDALREGSHTATITHAASSADGAYDGLAISDVVAAVLDNDGAGVLVSQTGGATAVSEDGAVSDSYALALQSEPTADVTVTIQPSAQLDVGLGAGVARTLTFQPAHWDTPQAVTVTAVDDLVAEGAHTASIAHAAASVDAEYDGLSASDVEVAITDDDAPAVSLAPTGADTTVNENGPTSDTYAMVLNTQPTADVLVRLSVNQQLDLGAGPGAAVELRFTTLDWNTPQTVRMTAVDDAVREGTHASTVTHAATSADPHYHGLAIDPITATIDDNDVAGLRIAEVADAILVGEGDAAAVGYRLQLDSEPVAEVSVTVSPGPQLDAGSGPGVAIALRFAPADWNVPQTVELRAVDDDVAEGAHTGHVRHTVASLDLDYDGIAASDLAVEIRDNDSPNVVLIESGGSTRVSEAGPTSDAYTLVLGSQPTGDVRVQVEPDAALDVGAGPGEVRQVLFTASDWQSAQTVIVTAVPNGRREGVRTAGIRHVVSSADPAYHAFAPLHLSVILSDVETDVLGGVSEPPPGDVYTEVIKVGSSSICAGSSLAPLLLLWGWCWSRRRGDAARCQKTPGP